jgi:hypothetical protein
MRRAEVVGLSGAVVEAAGWQWVGGCVSAAAAAWHSAWAVGAALVQAAGCASLVVEVWLSAGAEGGGVSQVADSASWGAGGGPWAAAAAGAFWQAGGGWAALEEVLWAGGWAPFR